MADETDLLEPEVDGVPVDELPPEEGDPPPQDEDDGPVVVRIEGVEEEEEGPENLVKLVRHLRTVIADQGKRMKEQSKAEPEVVVEAMPARPARADYDYDDDKYDAALDKWHEDKREWQGREDARKADQAKAETRWQATVESYNGRKASLKVDDFELAETAVAEVFDAMRIGVIVEGCDKPELVMYALGKNPAKLKEFASIESIAKFGIAIGKFEDKLKVEKRTPPPPEGSLKGNAPISGVFDNKLEVLRADAAKTGDYSEVVKHKRKMA